VAISRRTRRVDVVAQFEEDGSRGILNKDWVHHGKSEACGWSANIGVRDLAGVCQERRDTWPVATVRHVSAFSMKTFKTRCHIACLRLFCKGKAWNSAM